jgi:hypothetical protein
VAWGRKRQHHHHHQRTNRSTIVRTLQVQTLGLYKLIYSI